MPNKRVLCLFDMDGTLTKSRNPIDPAFDRFLQEKIKPLCNLGIVGGSDFKKIAEQMNGDDVIKRFDYVFAENGLIAYKNGAQLPSQSIQKFMGEQVLQNFINFALKYLSGLTLPVKRGTFVEFRTGMLNICPVGRSCSQKERDEFEQYDLKHSIRKRMIDALNKEFPNNGLTYSIGGQISFDVFPNGWDKTYCLQHVVDDFDEVHFFGDKTDKGGNDFEIFSDSRTIGHKVANPEDTRKQLVEMFGL